MNNVSVSILEGGPVKYISATTVAVTDSGVIFDSGSVAITNNSRIIYLENLGGFVKIKVHKDSTDLIPSQTHYQKVQKYGDVSQIMGKYTVRHFSLPVTGIDYNAFGMYLNAKIYDK
jgi:hypothetical protein